MMFSLTIQSSGSIRGTGPAGTTRVGLIYHRRVSVSFLDEMGTTNRSMGPVIMRLDMIELGGRMESVVIPVQVLAPALRSKLDRL